jgi:hypothetical protein
MIWKCVCVVLGVVVGVLLMVLWCRSGKHTYDADDVHHAHKALKELQTMRDAGREPAEMDLRDIDRLDGDIQMAGLKHQDEGKTEVEGYDSMKFPRYPPATLKALYESGVPVDKVYVNWPQGLYNRGQYWYPGFQTSGWSWWLRPMQKYGTQSFWVKNNGNYFYIRN